MKSLGRICLIGLSVLLPVTISVKLVIWIIGTLELWLRPIWLFILPENWYLPGFAIVSFILVAIMIGVSSLLPRHQSAMEANWSPAGEYTSG